ncbi:hypothetical protein M0R45_006883 [Rubus argutus]|uniref:Uncharacterized protein n=1 Tax=Rubus argutus TaxID=59490 RepID=A0AAW1YSF0_RUBAR
MGGLVLEIGSQISKFVIISIKTCYRSVGKHPFVVGILLFFIFLHRSFPLLFSLLVSTSPVLVCTAVLLGTLLSFGQSNIPDIENEDRFTHDSASLRTWVPGDDTVVVERDVSFSTEKFSVSVSGAAAAATTTTTRDVVDASLEEARPTYYRVNGEVGDHDVYVPLINENLVQTQSDKRVIEDVDRDTELENQRNIYEEKLRVEGRANDVEDVEKQYTLLEKVRDQIFQVKDDISPRGSLNAHRGEHLDSFVGGFGNDNAADNDEGDEDSDSESDGAESSSPDASMADILPILDELHPLLDLEVSQPAHIPHDGSDAASDRSDRSNDSSVESDEDDENQDGQVEEDGVGYNGGDEEEMQAQGGKEDENKSAITWTEDDQKNLMDLGNLELERNQRLENLIARRRARKSFKLTAEKNLIDFDGVDLPFNVSPISTTRRNPFDFPYDDSYGNMGLPPIPGSAPSILLARRNPFDLPYDSNEEKPDLKGDHFEQEFIALHANDAFFRRHESFSLGASNLGDAKQERQDLKWRPVFVPERLASEGTRHSSFQRQLSEVSESKLSSVPDTDSVSSVADLDDRKFSEQDFTKETEIISNIYHASGLVDHGSHSYDDVYSLEMLQDDKRDVLNDGLEIKLGERENLEPSLSDNGGSATLVEQVTNELHLNPELVEEEDSSSRSSLSSLSEADAKNSDVRKGGNSLESSGDLVKEFLISPQHSLQESVVQFMSRTVDGNQFEEPVYDSIPHEAENLISLNSISSDMQAEITEIVAPQASAEQYQDSDMHGESIEKATSGNEAVCGATSKVHGADAVEGDLVNYNQLQLSCSHSEVEVNLSRNLEVNAASSDSSYRYLLSDEQTSEQEKNLSWLDKSMVEPCLDDHLEALVMEDNIKEEVDDIKEIDAQLLLELDTVGDFSVKEVVAEPLHVELITEEANAVSTGSGLSITDSNLSEPNQELPVLGQIHEEVDIDGAFKQIHEGVDVEEVMLSSVVDNELEVEISKSTVQTSSELLIVEATSLEDSVTSSNQASNGSVNEFPQLLDTEGSAEVPLEDIPSAFNTHTPRKQLSEGNVGELPNPSNSNNVLAEVGSELAGEIVSSNIGVEETITTDTPLRQVSEDDVGELPNPSNSKDVLAEVGIQAVGEIVSSNIGVEETITTDTPLREVSEDDVGELPNPSNSKVVSAKVGTEAVEEIVSSNVVFGVEETITTDTPLRNVSEDDVGELPNPSNSNDVLAEVGTEAVGEIVSSNVVFGVEETITTDTPLRQASEDDVGELPKPSHPKDVSEEVRTKIGDSIEEIGSSNTGSSVGETIPTHAALKQVSESNVGETIEIASSNREVVPEIATQVSEKNVGVGVGELPNPSNSNDGLAE